MEYQKTLFFKMSHGNDCLAPPQAPTQSTVASTESTSTLAGITTTSFKIGQAVTNFFLQPSNATATTPLATPPAAISTTSDPYSTYADNFDLSLLPQDCMPTVEDNINHIYPYNINDSTNAQTPQIKIELAWPNDSSGPLADDIKQEDTTSSLLYEQLHQQQYQNHQQQHTLQVPAKSTHQLIPPPPPPYPYAAYPSPQSSPAQSEYGFPQTHGFASPYESLSSSRSSLYHPASPCPSLTDATVASGLVARIKQELHILPPSPPESSCETPSPQSNATTPFEIKSEPFDTDAEAEALVDLNALIAKEVSGGVYTKLETPKQEEPTPQHHQLLREYLEDTTFQKRHNLKPLALESFFGDLEEVSGNIEPVISLALEHAKREADETCAKLQISQDPSAWSPLQVHAWLRSTIAQFKLPQIDDLEAKFCENGAALILLSEEEFVRRSPESGSTLHAQLEIWKLAFTDCYQISTPTTNGYVAQQTENVWRPSEYTIDVPMDGEEANSEDDDDTPSTVSNSTSIVAVPTVATQTTPETKRPTTGRTGGSHIHLWQFLKELLSQPHVNGTAIRWMDRGKGVFKIEDSVRVAKLWGKRKNRPAMNYDKLSRSIRQYYKKGIMKKTERSQRLVYQFCHPYHL